MFSWYLFWNAAVSVFRWCIVFLIVRIKCPFAFTVILTIDSRVQTRVISWRISVERSSSREGFSPDFFCFPWQSSFRHCSTFICHCPQRCVIACCNKVGASTVIRHVTGHRVRRLCYEAAGIWKHANLHAKVRALTGVTTKLIVVGDVTTCSLLERCRCFGGIYCLYLRGTLFTTYISSLKLCFGTWIYCSEWMTWCC
jgi:hypothetical protein